jgi:hypothetical protein
MIASCRTKSSPASLAANRTMQALWGIDFDREKRRITIAGQGSTGCMYSFG